MKVLTLSILAISTIGSYATSVIVSNGQGPTATNEVTNAAGALVTGWGGIGIINEAGINGINTTFSGLEYNQWGLAGGPVTISTAGQFSFQDNVNPTGTPFSGQNVYLLVGFGGADLASSTELFIYRFDTTFGTTDQPTPITLTLGAGDIGTTLLGTETGSPETTTSGRFNASVIIPEPSAALLGAIGVLGLLRRRRI